MHFVLSITLKKMHFCKLLTEKLITQQLIDVIIRKCFIKVIILIIELYKINFL